MALTNVIEHTTHKLPTFIQEAKSLLCICKNFFNITKTHRYDYSKASELCDQITLQYSMTGTASFPKEEWLCPTALWYMWHNI